MRKLIARYEVITTVTDVIMVMEYAGEELFNYIVQKGKGGVRLALAQADIPDA
jgi:carbon catabolite-derepressing protein kinase